MGKVQNIMDADSQKLLMKIGAWDAIGAHGWGEDILFKCAKKCAQRVANIVICFCVLH